MPNVIMLNGIMLKGIMLKGIMPNGITPTGIMLTGIMLSVVVLSVTAPLTGLGAVKLFTTVINLRWVVSSWHQQMLDKG